MPRYDKLQEHDTIYMRRGAKLDFADVNSAITALTAASGTADNTVADVGASFNQTTLNNNFKDLASKVNEILTAIKNAGITP